MISEKMKELLNTSSVTRAMFEEGKRLCAIYGKDEVFDFSLGNPSVAPPVQLKEALLEVVNEEDEKLLHGYMNNSGYEDVRKKVADTINKNQGTNFTEQNIIMTVGAAGGLNVILKVILNPADEVIVFAPFFGEYKNYISNYDGKIVIIPPDTETFLPNLNVLKEKITGKTKAVIVNTPNNPSGVVYSEDVIKQLSKVLEEAQDKFGTSIYLISDEPYRELVYDNQEVPYITKYYKNTVVGYSFSKSLSLPGERIGYLVIPSQLDGSEEIIQASNVANRILGFVNAPSLMQRAVAYCLDCTSPMEEYYANRELFYNSLTKMGYECVYPQGTFYLFIKSLEEDDTAFCNKAKEHRILMVPGAAYACKGYARIAYCVEHKTIESSLKAFEKLYKEYNS